MKDLPQDREEMMDEAALTAGAPKVPLKTFEETCRARRVITREKNLDPMATQLNKTKTQFRQRSQPNAPRVRGIAGTQSLAIHLEGDWLHRDRKAPEKCSTGGRHVLTQGQYFLISHRQRVARLRVRRRGSRSTRHALAAE